MNEVKDYVDELELGKHFILIRGYSTSNWKIPASVNKTEAVSKGF